MGGEEAEREKERLEDKRHDELIKTLQTMTSGGKGGGKKKGGIFGMISGLLGGAGGGIASMAKGVVQAFGAVVNTITEIVERFVQLIRTVITTIIDIVQKIATAIADVITKIGSAIATVIEKVFTALGRGLAAMGSGPALLGALALVIVAAGIFVLAKAFVEFTKVNFTTLAIGIIAIVALTAVMMGLGMMMASGVGAVALLLGAAAMLIIAGAALVLGIAFKVLGEGLVLIMGSLGSFLDDILPGFIQMANPGVGAGLVLAAAGIVVLTAAIVGFMAVLSLAGAAGAAGGIVSGALGSISSFFGGPGSPPGPFEMLDKFIGFAEAAPFLQKGADAIGVIGSALSTFMTMNFAAVGAELGQLAMILLSFDAVSMGISGGALGLLSFGVIKAKSPLDILKELVKLAPGVKTLGDGIFRLAQGLQMISGMNSDNLQSATAAVAIVGKSSGGAMNKIASGAGMSDSENEMSQARNSRAGIVKRGPRNGSWGAQKDYDNNIANIDKHISQLQARLSSGGYAAGGKMDASTRRLQESKANKQQQAMTPRYQEVNTMQVNQTQQYLGGMSARSPGVADDDDL